MDTKQPETVAVGSDGLLAVLEAAHAAVAEIHGALHAAEDWGHGHLCSQIERALERAMSEQRGTARLLNVARGCHDYGGGYRDPDKAEIFHHGIQTVINALEGATRNMNDTQAAALERIGASSANKADLPSGR